MGSVYNWLKSKYSQGKSEVMQHFIQPQANFVQRNIINPAQQRVVQPTQRYIQQPKVQQTIKTFAPIVAPASLFVPSVRKQQVQNFNQVVNSPLGKSPSIKQSWQMATHPERVPDSQKVAIPTFESIPDMFNASRQYEPKNKVVKFAYNMVMGTPEDRQKEHDINMKISNRQPLTPEETAFHRQATITSGINAGFMSGGIVNKGELGQVAKEIAASDSANLIKSKAKQILGENLNLKNVPGDVWNYLTKETNPQKVQDTLELLRSPEVKLKNSEIRQGVADGLLHPNTPLNSTEPVANNVIDKYQQLDSGLSISNQKSYGKHLIQDAEGNVTSYNGGVAYPDWLPQEYRQKHLVEKVMNSFDDTGNPIRPTGKAGEIYDMIHGTTPPKIKNAVETAQSRYDRQQFVKTQRNAMVQAKGMTPMDAMDFEARMAAPKSPRIEPFDEILQKTPVKNKINVIDLLRTPDRVMQKIGLGNETVALRKGYDSYLKELPVEMEKITKWAERTTQEENVAIFKWLDGQDIQLTTHEQEIAQEVRTYLSHWATRLRLPAEKRISNYITRIFEKDINGTEFPEDIAKIIADKVPGSVYDPFTMERLGKQGYIEDTWRALSAYIKRGTRKANLDPMLEQISNKSQSLELSQLNYVKNYIDRVNMRPTNADALIDNWIKTIPGVGYKLGQRPTTTLTRSGRQMVYRGALGLNPASALRNLSQGSNTYAVLGERYTLKGYWDLFAKWKSNELLDSGVLKDDFIQDRNINYYKSTLQKADNVLFWMFETAEHINRGSAYYGAKAKGLVQGMSEENAINYAKKVVRDTQFVFGSIDTPVILQSDIMKTVGQFQSFTLKQSEFLTEMAMKKNWAGLARWLGSSLLFTYTLGKLFGMEPKDLIPSFRFGMPATLNLPYQAFKYASGAKNQYGQPTGAKDVGNAALLFAPGGVQAKKTYGGLHDVYRGYADTNKGQVKYPVKKSIENYIRGGAFGPYNLPEAQTYRDNEGRPLSAKQSADFKSNGISVYDQAMKDRLVNNQKEAVKTNGKDKPQEISPGVYQLADGSFYSQLGGEYKTLKTQDDLQLELYKEEIRTGKRTGFTMPNGDVYYRAKDGSIRKTTKKAKKLTIKKSGGRSSKAKKTKTIVIKKPKMLVIRKTPKTTVATPRIPQIKQRIVRVVKGKTSPIKRLRISGRNRDLYS